ncbi:hypothetical protein GDO81_029217, partial [Engystomops pustulosus]
VPRHQAAPSSLLPSRGLLTTSHLNVFEIWKPPTKYTINPIGKKKTGGRDHTGASPSDHQIVYFLSDLGDFCLMLSSVSYFHCAPGRVRVRGVGGGHKQLFRMIDLQRLRYEPGRENTPFQEKVVEVRYDPCRSADIALVAGGKRKRWIIATENMKAGDLITSSGHIGRMAVSAQEGDAHPLGAMPVGTLVNCLETEPGKGAYFIRAAGTCGVLLRKVNGTAIVQLPSKRQVQVSVS